MTRRSPRHVDLNAGNADLPDIGTFLNECASLTTSSADITELEVSAQSAARLLKLLASEQRLLILCKLFEGEANVSDLSEHAHLTPSATSQHLAKMRAEGLVTTRRDGQTIYYSLKDPAAMKVIETLCEIYR